jgi:RNA polymerase sigma factor (sigma-70 family)
MTKFNPDFWEVNLESASWEKFTQRDVIWPQSEHDPESLERRDARIQSVWTRIQPVMARVLTARQREIVHLYYFEELNQRQIAERLNISQQSVSEHLYGKVRKGKTVGGAIRKLRRNCLKYGIHFAWID